MEEVVRTKDNKQSDPIPKLFTFIFIPIIIVEITLFIEAFVPYNIYLQVYSFLNKFLILLFPVGFIFGFFLFFFLYYKIIAKKLKHELLKAKEEAKAIITSMGEGLLVVDNEFKLVVINPAAERILEVSAADCLGRSWADIVSIYVGVREIPFSERTTVRVIQSGQVISTIVEDNHFYKIKNGKMFPIASVTAPIWEGDVVVGAVKVFRNATQEKENKIIIEHEVKTRTQELLKKNLSLEDARAQISRGWYQQRTEKARLLASIESLPRGYILTDIEGNLILVNSLAPLILGAKKPLLHLKDVQEAMGESFDIMDVFEKSLKHQIVMNAKDVIFGSKYLEIFSVPIYVSRNDAPIGVVILLEDVTEAKMIERSKDEFFSIASHELRTPLTAIRGNTSLIQHYYKNKLKDKSLIEMIDDIHESSLRLIAIVNDFLDLSRLEQKRLVFKNGEFSVEAIINKALYELESIAKDKKLTLTLAKTTEKLPNVLADPDRTEQIIYNIVGNALKFTEKGGVSLRILQDGDYIKIEVQDTGKGIPEANRSLLFRKFQQAGHDILTRESTIGTGLGLYISKLIVEAMGGKIALVESEVGKGSIFAFTLPIATKQKQITENNTKTIQYKV